jgi:hypothetical protein
MSIVLRRAGIGAVILFVLLAAHPVAVAQVHFGGAAGFRFRGNPNNPFFAQQQAMLNMQAARMALATSQTPVFVPTPVPAFNTTPAFNPAFVPPTAFNPVSGIAANPYLPVAPAFNPAASTISNPYSPTGAVDTALSNPYSPLGGGLGGYSPYYSPYSNPALGPGFTLMGQADTMRAFGQLIKDEENARILRQQYYQSRLETKKKAFELEMYIKANTPSFTEIEAKIGKQILRHIQTNSNPAEIVDGRSLNFLLDDVDKYRGKTPIGEYPLDENVLAHLNIKPAGPGNYSLGLLRNGGKLNFPTALLDLMPPEARKDLEARAQAVAVAAISGKEPDRNALKDLRLQIEQAMNQLLKKANTYDTSEYMDAQRFLNELDQARKGIDKGSAGAQVQFQQMLAKGEIKTLGDLLNVMMARGWRFGPALASDEAAYRALHAALASYDIALNQVVARDE